MVFGSSTMTWLRWTASTPIDLWREMISRASRTLRPSLRCWRGSVARHQQRGPRSEERYTNGRILAGDDLKDLIGHEGDADGGRVLAWQGIERDAAELVPTEGDEAGVDLEPRLLLGRRWCSLLVAVLGRLGRVRGRGDGGRSRLFDDDASYDDLGLLDQE